MLVKKLNEADRLLDLSETARLKAGYVVLKAGEEVGEHITKQKEEIIIVLTGKAKVVCEDAEKIVYGRSIVYIPEGAKHNVLNVGAKTLKYVYVAAVLSELSR